MLSIKRILVPYDFSAFSQEALRYGLNIAKQVGAELHVMHVEVLHGVPLTDVPSQTSKSETLHQRVEEENEALRPLFKEVVTFYAVGYDIAPGPAILAYTREYDIDLIVAGTHGRRGVRRFLLGSVTEELVRHAECPILTIPKSEAPALETIDIRRILVPTDFSKHSKEALLYAKELARLFGAQIDLLHVVNMPSQVTFYDTGLFSVYKFQPEVDKYALDQLKDFYGESQDGPPADNVRYAVTYDLEADGIVEYAKENPIDLIVMGTHGRSGVSFLLGNVTAKTIRRISCPAFIVRSFGKSLIGNLGKPEEEEEVPA